MPKIHEAHKWTEAEFQEFLRIIEAKDEEALERFLGYRTPVTAECVATADLLLRTQLAGEANPEKKFGICQKLRVLRGHGDLFKQSEAPATRPGRPELLDSLRAQLKNETDPAKKWELCRQLREARGHGDLFDTATH